MVTAIMVLMIDMNTEIKLGPKTNEHYCNIDYYHDDDDDDDVAATTTVTMTVRQKGQLIMMTANKNNKDGGGCHWAMVDGHGKSEA